MASPDALSDLKSRNLAAALAALTGDELTELRVKLLPDRLRAVNTETSKLLQMPQEIRDAIFDEILGFEKKAGVWITKKPTVSIVPKISLPSLFRVCHQLREEFAMKFWKVISICQMKGEENIERRVTNIDPKHKKFLTRVEYDAGPRPHFFDRVVEIEIKNKECAILAAKRLEDRLDLKPGIVRVAFPNRFDKEMACWFNHAMVNSLGEVEERDFAWE
ncbi:hypothetical protein CB0940_02469 [Cercospora beticola]|uniref:F-box domain-containing protein n=1 Tax=Cercospora beticola TaxID=122368 RepID=A0A2G5I2A8_CERBT|nr:hypothetical protein CB0940_02469 [Cercospora beticola]PIA98934.1 hypothetical protein CB0940_02469 [Cercospora beticola]WPA99605.1 hypothetical protein RHO25_004223 [Cercospora beticola]